MVERQMCVYTVIRLEGFYLFLCRRHGQLTPGNVWGA
jgi:hypothetical protein